VYTSGFVSYRKNGTVGKKGKNIKNVNIIKCHTRSLARELD
jgi:hypothetical protein